MKVSIIVANYNNGRYLPELIESIEKQTYSNWELVIADDCSTDDSIRIIQSYLTNTKIKLVTHYKNRGAGATFKTAMHNSTGDIIGMLGADDALKENALEFMVNQHYKYPDASLIYTDFYNCDENLQIIERAHYAKKIQEGKSFINSLYVCAGVLNTFTRKAYYKTEGFNSFFRRALDHDIWFKLEEVGNVIFVDEAFYYYRLHEGGISQFGNKEKAYMYHIMALKKAYFRRLKNKYPINIKKDKLLHYLRYYYFYNACENVNKNKIKCLYYLIQDLYYIPSDIKNGDFWSILLKNFGLNKKLPNLVSPRLDN